MTLFFLQPIILAYHLETVRVEIKTKNVKTLKALTLCGCSFLWF